MINIFPFLIARTGIFTAKFSPKSISMKALSVLFAILLFATSSFSQSFEWMKFLRTYGYAMAYSRVTTDNAGNVYTASNYATMMTIDGDTLDDVFAGVADDAFLTKFSADGTLQWSKHFGTNWYDPVLSIAVDEAGHIYVSFSHQATSIIFEDTTITVAGPGNPIIQFNNDGNFLRHHVYPGSFSVRLATLGNDLYTTHDYVITKHDSLFNTIWSRTTNPTNVFVLTNPNDVGDLYVSDAGYLVVCGYEAGAGTVMIDTVSMTFNGGFDDVGIVLMDTSGTALWGRVMEHTNAALNTFACAVDEGGNVFWGVDFHELLIFGNDTLINNTIPYYSALLAYDAQGNESWAVGLISDNTQPRIDDILVNDQQEIVIAGRYSAFGIPATFGDALLPIGNSLIVSKVDQAGDVVWAKTDNASSNASSQGFAIALVPNDKYAVTGQYSEPEQYGCFMSPPQYGVFTTVISEAPEIYPVASFTFSVNGLDYTFTDQSQNADAWLWDFGDGQTSTQQNPVHTFAAGGDYTIVLTAYKLACLDTMSSTILNVNVQDPRLLTNILNIFPNPAHDQTLIGYTLNKSQKVSLELCDPLGQILEKTDFGWMNEGVHYRVFNTEFLSSGIYFLRMKTETYYSPARLIKL